MTIKDLLDVYDKNRDHNDQWIKFVDGNFETVAKITSGSGLLDPIEDEEIEAIGVYEEDVITVWMKSKTLLRCD